MSCAAIPLRLRLQSSTQQNFKSHEAMAKWQTFVDISMNKAGHYVMLRVKYGSIQRCMSIKSLVAAL